MATMFDERMMSKFSARRARMIKHGTTTTRYFATLRVIGDDDKLHKTARSEDFVTLGEARTNLEALMSSADGKQEGSVGTIFRISKWGRDETIEHAVVVDGKIRQAYRSTKKWYEEVAPFIATSYYYHNSHLPPFLRDELML